MSEILVVGGGFAGVWAAAGAVRVARAAGRAGETLRVRMISDRDDMVVRPRLYEPNPASMRIDLDSILEPIGVKRVKARAETIDLTTSCVVARDPDGERLTASFDRLVLTSGSQLVRPGIPGAEHLFDIDTIEGAVALDTHLHSLPARTQVRGRYTVVVVGAGFTGIEIATEIGERLRRIAGEADGIRVVLVERADVPGPDLGDAPRPYILKALDELGVEQRLDRTVVSATADEVTLSDGEVIPAATVVWTVGMAASPLTAQINAPRDRAGRLAVDEYLRVVGVPTVYAAGDTAAAAVVEAGHTTIQSCQHAQPMGKYAGHNVAADLLGLPMLPFTSDPYSNAIDLGPAGAITTRGWERTVEASGQEAKAIKQAINTRWIYPPAGSADALLAKAAHFGNSA